MAPLISVIVPVYNVENLLDRCIQSIVSQTYNNLEIILVNDGSSDRSGIICDEWTKKDNRIRSFHKINGGAGDTRNYGVEKSNGEYIGFVDSDDVISPYYFEFLYKILTESNADISCCNFFKFNENYCFDDLSDLSKYDYVTMKGYDACKKMILSCDIFLISPCCKLIKSEIVKKCTFPTGYICEDEATSCRYYYYSNEVAISGARIYGYFDNSSSVMHSPSSQKINALIQMLNYRTDFFIECNEPEITSICINSLLHFILYNSRPTRKFNKNLLGFIKKYWFNKYFSFNSRKSLIYYLLKAKL